MKPRKPETLLVEAGRRREWTQGIVNPPVWRASTILFDSVADMKAANPPQQGVLHYGRNGTPTQWALCDALTELEPGAAGTWLYPSGVAAIATALLAILRPGDELLVADSVFAPTRKFCDQMLAQLAITIRYYDPLIGAGIEEEIGDRTRAIFLESPGSLTMEVQDVPAICRAGKARGLVTLLDNTWATPLLFPAIGANVDLSILACTKYVAGHADAMIGAVTAGPEYWPQLEKTSRILGQQAGPDDAFLALRGLRTLALRLKRHGEGALAVANWLEAQPQIGRVLHPALPSCPGHEHWLRDFKGASGLFSFEFEGGDDASRTEFIESLSQFGIGYSWGGYESLVAPFDPQRSRTVTTRNPCGPLVRLHIGLEDVRDLIDDLAQGLTHRANKGPVDSHYPRP